MSVVLTTSELPSTPTVAQLWRWLPVLLVVAVTLLVLPTIFQLRHLWTELGDAGYGHGPLLVVVVIWLLYRDSAVSQRPAGAGAARWVALATVAVLSVAWAAAEAASTSSIGQAIWPLLAWTVLASVYGWREARRFALPLGLLYFALPVWLPVTNYILWPLTIKVTSFAVQLLGLNAYVDRNFITIPSGSFEIIAGCSGQHFLLVACVIGLLIARLNDLQARQFWIVFGAAIAFALVTNWIRVTTIVIVGYVTEMRHPMVAEGHLTFGWLLFAAVILLYCVCARWYLNRLPPTAPAAPAQTLAAAGSARGIAIAALALAALGPLWLAAARAQAADARDRGAVFKLPETHAEWIGPLAVDSPVRPEFLGADIERRGVYRSVNAVEVSVYSNLYLAQRQGGELVGYGNALLPDSLWNLATAQYAPRGAAMAAEYRELSVADRGGATWVVRYAYVVAGRTIAGDLQSKVALGLAALTLRPPRAGIVVMGARCAESCAEATAAVASAWDTLMPDLRKNYES